MRNLLARIPHRDKATVADAARLVFDQPSRQSADIQLHQLAEKLSKPYPKAAHLLEQAEADILAYKNFPKEHWRRINSTNMLERLNKEVKRRTKVVGIFPDQPSVIRLVGTILKEIDEDWRGAQRRYFSQRSMRLVMDPDFLHDHEISEFLVELTTSTLTEA
jgi:transposase-like protein